MQSSNWAHSQRVWRTDLRCVVSSAVFVGGLVLSTQALGANRVDDALVAMARTLQVFVHDVHHDDSYGAARALYHAAARRDPAADDSVEPEDETPEALKAVNAALGRCSSEIAHIVFKSQKTLFPGSKAPSLQEIHKNICLPIALRDLLLLHQWQPEAIADKSEARLSRIPKGNIGERTLGRWVIAIARPASPPPGDQDPEAKRSEDACRRWYGTHAMVSPFAQIDESPEVCAAYRAVTVPTEPLELLPLTPAVESPPPKGEVETNSSGGDAERTSVADGATTVPGQAASRPVDERLGSGSDVPTGEEELQEAPDVVPASAGSSQDDGSAPTTQQSEMSDSIPPLVIWILMIVGVLALLVLGVRGLVSRPVRRMYRAVSARASSRRAGSDADADAEVSIESFAGAAKDEARVVVSDGRSAVPDPVADGVPEGLAAVPRDQPSPPNVVDDKRVHELVKELVRNELDELRAAPSDVFVQASDLATVAVQQSPSALIAEAAEKVLLENWNEFWRELTLLPTELAPDLLPKLARDLVMQPQFQNVLVREASADVDSSPVLREKLDEIVKKQYQVAVEEVLEQRKDDLERSAWAYVDGLLDKEALHVAIQQRSELMRAQIEKELQPIADPTTGEIVVPAWGDLLERTKKGILTRLGDAATRTLEEPPGGGLLDSIVEKWLDSSAGQERIRNAVHDAGTVRLEWDSAVQSSVRAAVAEWLVKPTGPDMGSPIDQAVANVVQPGDGLDVVVRRVSNLLVEDPAFSRQVSSLLHETLSARPDVMPNLVREVLERDEILGVVEHAVVGDTRLARVMMAELSSQLVGTMRDRQRSTLGTARKGLVEVREKLIQESLLSERDVERRLERAEQLLDRASAALNPATEDESASPGDLNKLFDVSVQLFTSILAEADRDREALLSECDLASRIRAVFAEAQRVWSDLDRRVLDVESMYKKLSSMTPMPRSRPLIPGRLKEAREALAREHDELNAEMVRATEMPLRHLIGQNLLDDATKFATAWADRLTKIVEGILAQSDLNDEFMYAASDAHVVGIPSAEVESLCDRLDVILAGSSWRTIRRREAQEALVDPNGDRQLFKPFKTETAPEGSSGPSCEIARFGFVPTTYTKGAVPAGTRATYVTIYKVAQRSDS